MRHYGTLQTRAFHLTKTQSHSLYLSPGTLKYLQLDAPQSNWDGTWSKDTHACGCINTHTVRHEHTKNHSRLSFKSQPCGKETSGREGIQLEKETNDTKTQPYTKITQMLSLHTHTHITVFMTYFKL